MKIRFRKDTETENMLQKRRHERRSSDQCVSEINGNNYPIINWSNGGALIFADDRLFAKGETIDLKMKFRVHDNIVSIPHAGKIIRTGASRVAIQFDELTETMNRAFKRVIDETISREFADSQV